MCENCIAREKAAEEARKNGAQVIEVNCSEPFLHTDLAMMKTNIVNFVAIAQALQMVVQNQELFYKTINDCADCYKRAGEVLNVISSILKAAYHQEEHRKEELKNVKSEVVN